MFVLRQNPFGCLPMAYLVLLCDLKEVDFGEGGKTLEKPCNVSFTVYCQEKNKGLIRH